MNVSYITVASNSTSVSLEVADFGKFYNITTSGLTTVFVPATGSLTDYNGFFWVLRNNTSAYLSLAVYYVSTSSTPNGISVPFVIAPSNSAVLMWNNPLSSFVIF